MLGTGHAMVTKCYNTCFAIKIKDEYFLVDAGGGNGIMSQLEKVGIPYSGIHQMFVTHGHTDHVLGAIWMIRKIATLMSNGKYQEQFVIYCHDELVDMIMTFCKMTLPAKLVRFLGTQIVFRVVKDGDQAQVNGMNLKFFDIHSKKAKQFGFHADLPGGKTLACLGDEPFNEQNRSMVENSDWMLCEAYCLYEEREKFKPYEKYHSTALDAGKLAEELNVRNLVLYHTEDSNLLLRKQRYTLEAKLKYRGTVFVPEDLETIEL